MSNENAQSSSGGKFIWGAEDIGKVISRNSKQTHYLLEKGYIPARKIGDQWVAKREHLEGIADPDEGIA
jgi:hypothetical protein